MLTLDCVVSHDFAQKSRGKFKISKQEPHCKCT